MEDWINVMDAQFLMIHDALAEGKDVPPHIIIQLDKLQAMLNAASIESDDLESLGD